MLTIIRPGLDVFQTAALIPLAGACSFAVYLVLTRLAVSRDGVGTATFYNGIVGLVVLSLILPI